MGEWIYKCGIRKAKGPAAVLSEGGRSHHRDIKDKKCSLRMRTVTRIPPHVVVHVVPSHVVMRIVPSHVVTQTLVVKCTEPESGVQRRAGH